MSGDRIGQERKATKSRFGEIRVGMVMRDGPAFEALGEPSHVIVDCDPGIDDALALLMLAQAHFAGMLIIDSVFTVGGNVAVEKTASNAALVLERAGLPNLKVIGGAGTPLAGTRVIVNGKSFHGPDGLGGLASDRRNAVMISKDPGRDLATRIMESPRQLLLLCTGPLTNLALALQSNPLITEMLSRVVVMGGALGNPAGNITPVAEFNFYLDPLAASIVIASGLPIELVALDTTEAVPFDAHDLDGLSGFAQRLLKESLRLHHEALGGHSCYVHDAVAAAVLLEPTIAKYERVKMSITTSGESAGHLARNDEALEDGPRVQVVSQIDGTSAKALFHSLLASEGVVGSSSAR